MINRASPHDEEPLVDDYGRDFIAKKHRFPANATGFLIAPIVWFAYFIAVYALQGAGCAAGLDQQTVLGMGTLRFALLVVSGLAAILIALSGAWSFRSWHRLLNDLEEEERDPHHHHSIFLAYGALLHAGLFLVATLWIAIPIILIDSCDFLGST